MDKIKVSEDVANALNLALQVVSKERLLNDHFTCMNWKLKEYEPLNEISNWKMAQILINGYEVEETPEEVLKGLYNSSCINKSAFDNGYKIAVEQTLRVLGIKIKGIND